MIGPTALEEGKDDLLFGDSYNPRLFISNAVHEGVQSPHHEGTCGSADVASGSASIPVIPTSNTGKREVPAVVKRVSCSHQKREMAHNRSTFCFERA